MTIETVASAPLSESDARRLTERIRYTAMGVRDGVDKLQRLVAEAQEGQAHVALGYASWTAYLAEVLGEEPLRLARDERREVVGWLAGQGMSARAIAPIVGADRKTVMRDVRESQVVQSGPPAPANILTDIESGSGEIVKLTGPNSVSEHLPKFDPATGEVLDDEPTPITGLDGKTYTRPAPAAPRRRPLVDAARDAGQELRKAVERLERLRADDRFARNKNEVAAHLRHHLAHAIEVCQDLGGEL